MGTVHFDESFDGGTWPGPFGAQATAGALWVGRAGLMGALEGQLGLSSASGGAAERLGQVVQALHDTQGFWSPSAEADALATAQELIRLYDALRLEGWTGQVKTPRLEALFALFRGVAPGAAERLEALVPAVKRAGLAHEVKLYGALDALPRRLRELLAVLGPASGPAALPAPTFSKRGAGLQLVRPYGPLVAADAVAQALAASRDVPTLLIGSDPVLDAALRRHGLPTTGAASSPDDNALGEVLPLVIELGLKPADPARAMELLTLPVGPIRGDVAYRLVRALQKWPAVGSITWLEAIAEATKDFDQPARDQLGERLEFLDATVDGAKGYPVAELLRRAGALNQWLQGRLAHAKTEGEQRQFGAAVAQCSAFRALVEAAAVASLTTAQVRRFLEQAREVMPTPPTWPAQVGLPCVDDPGGVVGPVPRLVWWDFTRASFTAPRRLPLSGEERDLLARAGVVVPSPSELALRRMVHARRPLQHRVDALWLIAPQHDASGEDAAPHPLWDEAVGALGEAARAHVHAEPQVATPPKAVKRKRLPLPEAVHAWPTSVAIARRDQESPSSVEHLLGCTLAWSLHYVAHLRSGTTASIDTSQRMLGTLAHYLLLERTLLEKHDSAEAAGRFALKLLDDEGPQLAAPLFMPGADEQLIMVREATRKAAEALWRRVEDGWAVIDTEKTYEGRAFGTKFAGGIDLVLGKRAKRVVVDLKWSGVPYRRQSLERGAAIQLASYAALLEEAGFEAPTVAYFIIQSQVWLSTSGDVVADELRVADPEVDTWALTKAAHAASWKQVAKGQLTAPGVLSDASEKTLVNEGVLQVAPPCGFCEFGGICGRRYGRIEVDDGEG